ncbi:hypothetical protein K1M80_15320 [Brucella abortus]|uniref:hypothetical protein n=1 Tax=Brucella abortus TaxID=235 RepID=UPI00278C4957|nr:hypothetical protein [Brucella abortus]WLU33141.1 hypothetical protein K1M80_15320 [Brucella abortus]
MKQREFTEDFKREAVRILTTSGRNISSPENHPQLLTNQQTVNPFSSVTQGRIRLPLPAPPPSLWRYIGPT